MRTYDRAQAIQFFKDRVIGKVLRSTPVTTFTDTNRIKAVYQDLTFFSNLAETATGFQLDLTIYAMGTRYQKGADGSYSAPEGSLNAIRVLRYEITERKSSGRLLGFARWLSSTNSAPDPVVGTIFLVEMWMENGDLFVQETQAGYSDWVAIDGSYTSIASDVKYRYAMQGHKLVVEAEQATYSVDPESMRRTPTGDQFPKQISSELDFYANVTATGPQW